MKNFLKKIIPASVFTFFQPAYHYLLALTGALIYHFPARNMYIIGVTGTKGKSSTTEIINSILEKAGHKTALTNTIRFKIADTSERNLYKMSMPGLFFMQKFLARAKKAGCTHVVLEMTSEGAKQFRHKWIDLDAFVFTNISPEHIESHGSYENYRSAKLSIGELLETSKKPNKILAANSDDPEAFRFLALKADKKVAYSLRDVEPHSVSAASNDSSDTGTFFTFHGTKVSPKLIGLFNIYNALAAAAVTDAMGIPVQTIKDGIENVAEILGRVEKVRAEGVAGQKQNFDVVVDYAHTIDSLEKLYQAFPNQRKICVLGNTGGGRDTWKRPGMAKIADQYCDHVILTNEDPYDENPQKILDEMRVAVTNKPLDVIMDRREAIAKAISLARAGDAVLISGKGTDPYIMEANGKKTPWSDVDVAREELQKLLQPK